MNVLHVDTRPDWRGGQSQVLLLLQGLRARGHRAELLVMEETPLAERARAAGIVVHAQPARLWPLAGPRTIRRLIAATGFRDRARTRSAWTDGGVAGAGVSHGGADCAPEDCCAIAW
jgi:hypothetical protein